jgi:uncharacterized protein YggU (UPF0235/DUF167 family)
MVPNYELPPWLEQTATGVVLQVKVTVNGTRNRVSGQSGATLLVTLDCQGADGKANQALVRFLAEAMGVASAQIDVVAGGSGKIKKVQIEAVKPAQVSMRLSPK